jgi:hypothetical protein
MRLRSIGSELADPGARASTFVRSFERNHAARAIATDRGERLGPRDDRVRVRQLKSRAIAKATKRKSARARCSPEASKQTLRRRRSAPVLLAHVQPRRRSLTSVLSLPRSDKPSSPCSRRSTRSTNLISRLWANNWSLRCPRARRSKPAPQTRPERADDAGRPAQALGGSLSAPASAIGAAGAVEPASW